MNDSVLFHDKQLTVDTAKISVGNTSIYYPNLSSVRIYSGRPWIIQGFALLTITTILLIALPSIGKSLGISLLIPTLILGFPMGALGLALTVFKLKCLILTVDGNNVFAFRTKDFRQLQVAKEAIETAKRSFQSSL